MWDNVMHDSRISSCDDRLEQSSRIIEASRKRYESAARRLAWSRQLLSVVVARRARLTATLTGDQDSYRDRHLSE
jgi:hypothetical protein